MPITDSQFWRFASMLYRYADLREILLGLQDDHQVVILELLFAVWLADQGVAWSKMDHHRSRQHIGSWVDEVVLPLRQLRLHWRATKGRDAGYQHLLSMELDAEQHLADLLLDKMPTFDAQTPCWKLLDANLLRVLPEDGIADETRERLMSLLQEAGLKLGEKP